jgi:hypothetical protein
MLRFGQYVRILYSQTKVVNRLAKIILGAWQHQCTDQTSFFQAILTK